MSMKLAIIAALLVSATVVLAKPAAKEVNPDDSPFITPASLFSPVGEFVWQQDDYDLTLDFKCNPDNADQLYLKFTQTYTKGETAPIESFTVAGVTPELTLCSYDSSKPGVSEGGADVSASSKEVDGKVVNTIVCLWNFTLPVDNTEFSISFSNGNDVVTNSPPSCLASFFQVPTPQCGVANIVVNPAVFVSPSGVFDWEAPTSDGALAKYNMDVTCGKNQFKVVFNQDTEKDLGDAGLSFLSVKGIKDFDGVDFCRFGNDTDTGIPFTVERTTSKKGDMYRTTITCLWPINFPTDPIEFFVQLSNEPAQAGSPPTGLSTQPPPCVASYFQTPNKNCVNDRPEPVVDECKIGCSNDGYHFGDKCNAHPMQHYHVQERPNVGNKPRTSRACKLGCMAKVATAFDGDMPTAFAEVSSSAVKGGTAIVCPPGSPLAGRYAVISTYKKGDELVSVNSCSCPSGYKFKTALFGYCCKL